MTEGEKDKLTYVNYGKEEHELSADEILLKSLGYNQDLSRSISGFSNFAIAFSSCSVLSGLTPLWGDAMLNGGSSSIIWGWVVTSLFTTCVAMSLAEICSAYPTTGGIYFWVSRLATSEWMPLACWVTGWCNWISLTVGITSIDLGLAQFIAGLVSIWQPEAQLSVYTQYGIFVGILIIHGLINSIAVDLNGVMNQCSFYANTIGILVIVIAGLAITKPLNTADFVFTHFYNGSGFSSNGFAFLLVILQSQYTLSGYDAAAHMAEETINSQQGSPYGILFSVVANGISGLIFLIGCGFMIQDYDRQIISDNAIRPQLIQVFKDGVGLGWTVTFVIFVMLSTFFTGSALTLGSSRMVFAFSRDGAMPGSGILHRLHPTTKSPVNAVWFSIVVAGAVGVLVMINSTAFEAIVSINTIGSQLSYLVPILLRITSSRTKFVPGPFRLGRASLVIGWISSVWLALTCVLFVLPTQAPVTPDNMNYAILPFGAVLILTMTYFHFWGRKWFTGPVRVVHGKEIILTEEDDVQDKD